MATIKELLDALGGRLPDYHRIEHVITAGQKHVFKAEHKGKPLALKAIFVGVDPKEPTSPEELEDADDVSASAARLHREIEILRKCRSKHIVALAHPDYFEFLIARERFGAYGEQWIDGKDLRVLFRERRLTRAEAIGLGLALCDAIKELDEHGYVHRDIKPQNVMLQVDGTFLLVDPGMALDRAGRSLTSAGNVAGTVEYLSPEQWDPHRKRDLDARSDMFSVGIVLFQALAGIHPFYEQGMGYLDVMTASRSMTRHELENDSLSADDPLRAIISRLLSPKVHGRYRDTAALRQALEAAT